jgi:hypothetical protein
MALSASQALPTLPHFKSSRHGLLTQHKLIIASPSQQLQLSARRSCCCSFSKALLPQLFGPKQRQTQPDKPASPLYSVDGVEEQASAYSSLLQQAEDITFNCSSAHRSMLEDAERMLVLCIEVGQHCQDALESACFFLCLPSACCSFTPVHSAQQSWPQGLEPCRLL